MASTKDDVKVTAQKFHIEIKGLFDKVPNTTQGDPGGIRGQVNESTQGDNPEYRTFNYGNTEYDECRIVMQQNPGVKKLQEWVEKAQEQGGGGDAIRRDVSFYVYARNGKDIARVYDLHDCFPQALETGDQSTASEVKSVTLVLKVGWLEARA